MPQKRRCVCLDCLVALCLQEGTMPQHLNHPGKQIVPLPAVTPCPFAPTRSVSWLCNWRPTKLLLSRQQERAESIEYYQNLTL